MPPSRTQGPPGHSDGLLGESRWAEAATARLPKGAARPGPRGPCGNHRGQRSPSEGVQGSTSQGLRCGLKPQPPAQQGDLWGECGGAREQTGSAWGLCPSLEPQHPYLLLPRPGLLPGPLGQLLAVLQGGQQPHRPSLGVNRLLLVLHTQAALGVPAVPRGWQSWGRAGVIRSPQQPDPRALVFRPCLPPALGEQPPATSPGHTHLEASASGWRHAGPDSWLSWWRGPRATQPLRRCLVPGPGSGWQPGAPASGQSQVVGVGGPTQLLPSGGQGGTASWAFGTHCFLSHPEELGHISDDVAEVVVYLDVGAHPGWQLGSGICTGEPGREGPSAQVPPTPAGAPCGERATPVVTEEDGPIVVAMPDDPPDGLVHGPGRLLPVPVLPRKELGEGEELVTRSPGHQVPPTTWHLTWPEAPLRPFISSRNCILRMTRGSLRGGYGRPVTTTPRPFTSAKSSPSLAWGEQSLPTRPTGACGPSPGSALTLTTTSSQVWTVRDRPPTLGQALAGVHTPRTPRPLVCSWNLLLLPTCAHPGRPQPGSGGCPPNSYLLEVGPKGRDRPVPPTVQSPGPSRAPMGEERQAVHVGPRLTFPRHTARKAAPRDPGEATVA